jgi:hypothetical protein
VTLDGALFKQAVRLADGALISDQLPVPIDVRESDDDLLYYNLEE